MIADQLRRKNPCAKSTTGIFYCLLGITLLAANLASAQVVRPIPVPGRIEAENYDTNGPGISYYDTTPGNSGGAYRTDDVDIEATTDTGGGYDVGWIASGEWLNYTVNVQTTAVYQVAFRVASGNGTGRIQLSLDGLPLCSVTTPFTGGWQTWQTVTVSNLALRAGTRLLQIAFPIGGQNLNYLQVTKQRDLSGGFLHVSGQQIVDAQGNNVSLRGIGIGNWMVQEPYMMDVSGIAANQQDLKAKISDLVGTNSMLDFYNAWLTNSLTGADIAAIAAAGFNSIRVPLHYNLFTLPIQQEPVPGQNTWLTNGFYLLDKLAAWCQTNQVYLILDMHACPGGEGHDQPISDYNPALPSLWENVTNRTKLVALWQQLANRYATNNWIGGYDLINEPNWTFENNSNLNGCNDQTNAPLRQLFMDITAAIRQVDTNHIIIIEGNCWAGNYNGLLPSWDNNLVASFHKYFDQATAASLQQWADLRSQWNVPVWLGESGENQNDWFRDVVRYVGQLNIGWSWWPWKKIGTIAGPVMIQEPAGYKTILNYWNGTATRPSTNDALAGLMALAQAARYENCAVHRDVFDALMRPNPQGVTLPFKTNTVPGTIFAADYDMGHYGDSYVDMTTNSPYNSGNLYRNDAVDIEACSDIAPTIGYDVGWLDVGDWMKYSVTIPTGVFGVSARVAANAAGGQFHVEAGTNLLFFNIPATGGWQSWAISSQNVFTNKTAASSFRVVIDSSGFNLNWLQFTNLLPAPPTGLSASASTAQVNLQWNPVNGATSYQVKRSVSSGSNYVLIAFGLATTNFIDIGVTNGTKFYYVVTAKNSYGESAASTEASVAVPLPRLSADLQPGGVRLWWTNPAASLSLQSTTNITLTSAWTPLTNLAFLSNNLWQILWMPSDTVRFFRLAQ
jgi:hypothetical protein